MNPPLNLPDLIEIEVEEMNEDTKVQIINRSEILNSKLDSILDKINKRKRERKDKK